MPWEKMKDYNIEDFFSVSAVDSNPFIFVS